MKRLYTLLFPAVFMLMTTLVRSETILTGPDANKLVPGAFQINIKEGNQVPSFIRFETGKEPAFQSAEEWTKNTFKFDPNYNLELINVDRDELGFTHYRFRQTFLNRAIDGTMWIIHVKNGII